MEAAIADAPVVLTERAIKQVLRQKERLGKQGQFLRLGVRGGGCSGLSYVIDWETEPDDEFDVTYTQDDVAFVIDIKSAKYLQGTVLDFDIKNLMEGGFTFQNPLAVRSCGCGTSFTLK
ncbi:MAG: HesB/IscA family protein [Armatimonadaceae bacterium]|jgi:iron-sulfur cluster assembly protein